MWSSFSMGHVVIMWEPSIQVHAYLISIHYGQWIYIILIIRISEK